ncbi:MAG TPA: hypothetical protein VFK02_18595 [Kofleriaceae bacterium]|nr:hypothetical protein [Kofleriaceae bacterium]
MSTSRAAAAIAGDDARRAGAWDADEVLLWTIMRMFEVQASAQYHALTPELAVLKGGAAPVVVGLPEDEQRLENSILGAPMKALLASAAEAGDDGAALVIQGLVLERVRRIVYATLVGLDDLSERSKAVALALGPVSAEVVARTPSLFAAACARTGQAPFALFTEASDDVLHKLDAVGEGVDELFGPRFGLRFPDIIGDFVAELVPVCVKFGMDRRNVMAHLAGALMGI